MTNRPALVLVFCTAAFAGGFAVRHVTMLRFGELMEQAHCTDMVIMAATETRRDASVSIAEEYTNLIRSGCKSEVRSKEQVCSSMVETAELNLGSIKRVHAGYVQTQREVQARTTGN